MSVDQILAAVGIYAGTFVVGAVSSVIPIVSIEVFLVAITLAHGGGLAVGAALVLLATCGQVLGKLPVYFATRGLAGLPGRHHAHVERARRWVARANARPAAVLAVSAIVGLPPFSLASTAAGALGIPPRTFCTVVAAGRAVRFAVLITIAACTQI